MTDIICDQSKPDCPYRLIDLEKDKPLCDYFHLKARFVINREFSKLSTLIRKACEWVQKEESRLGFIRKIAHNTGLDVLRNVQIGDTVFCEVGTYHEVKLLEKPSKDSIFAWCQAPNGKVFQVQPCNLRRLSKGHYSGDYFIEGVDNKKRAQQLEFKAKYHGFRAEVEKKENGYLLKIYGDSQQEVDDFINLFLKFGLELIP